MTALKPFADDAASLQLGGLTVENGTLRIALYGNLEITRDKAGLSLARQMRALLDQVVATLETGSLPDRVPPPVKPTTVKNPFS